MNQRPRRQRCTKFNRDDSCAGGEGLHSQELWWEAEHLRRRPPLGPTEEVQRRQEHCMMIIFGTLSYFYPSKLLYDQFKRLPQDISEPWLHWLKLTYHPSSITNNVSKNWSMTLKGLRGAVLRALIEKTPNFWPIEPIELKFWHLILIMECLKISLRGSHGSTFGPLWWP